MRQLVYVYFFEGNCSGEISNFASSGRFFSNILAGMEDVLFWIVQNDNLTMFLRCMAHRYHPHPDCASLVGRYDLALGAFLRRILFFAHNDSDELIATKIHLRNSHFAKKTYIYTYIYFIYFFFSPVTAPADLGCCNHHVPQCDRCHGHPRPSLPSHLPGLLQMLIYETMKQSLKQGFVCQRHKVLFKTE